MAHLSRRLSNNAAGDFFVDSSCIDCDICRQVAPETLHARAGQTIVARQPSTPDAVHRALMALVACPTGSIGTTGKHPIKAAIAAFPEEIAAVCTFAVLPPGTPTAPRVTSSCVPAALRWWTRPAFLSRSRSDWPRWA